MFLHKYAINVIDLFRKPTTCRSGRAVFSGPRWRTEDDEGPWNAVDGGNHRAEPWKIAQVIGDLVGGLEQLRAQFLPV